MKVKIRQIDYTEDIEIMFLDKHPNGDLYLAKPVELIFEKYEGRGPAEPTIRISRIMAPEFLQAMAEELDKKGIKTDKDAKIEGTLEATRYHLEDLRTILKIK